MRLGLSSAAAPEAPFDELLAACVRRGLGSLELREEDGHGVVGPRSGIGGEEARRRADDAGVVLTGLRSGAGGGDLRLARIAGSGDIPVVVAGGGLVGRLERAIGIASVGASAVVTIDADPDPEDLDLAAVSGFPIAWDVRLDGGSAGSGAERVLHRLGRTLRQVRIRGGGPESVMQEGRGVGELMGRLALAGYDGAVVLAPSSTRYRVAWESWLGRRGGWGCGSKESDPSLVRLDSGLALGGAR